MTLEIGWVLLFLGLSVADGMMAAAMHKGKEWRILLAGNPAMPDGRPRYHMTEFRRSAEILLWVYTVVFFMMMVMIFLVKVVSLFSESFLAAALYIQGAVLVIGYICFLGRMDTYFQTATRDMPLDETE